MTRISNETLGRWMERSSMRQTGTFLAQLHAIEQQMTGPRAGLWANGEAIA